MDYTFPEHLFYERVTHMWALPESDTRIRVGIDPLGLSSLGELAYLSLNASQSRVQSGQPMGMLEAAKMTGEMIAPVNGTLVERNPAVLEDPFVVNQDPYGKGWLAVIETESWPEDSARLVSGTEILEWSAHELERYREQGWIEG